MTDTANAPERIWTADTTGNCSVGFNTPSLDYKNEYISRIHCDELVAAAWRDIADTIASINGVLADPILAKIVSQLRAKTPDDARAALTAYGERMKAEGASEAQAKIARLTEALTYYNDQFCEGFCSDVPAGFTNKDMENDCSGCRARAALQENANG